MIKDSTITTVRLKRQITIPKYFGIKQGQRIKWIMHPNGVLQLIVLPDDLISALEGSTKGSNHPEKLLQERRQDRRREEKKFA